jgi:hypothetical protein
VLKKTLTTLMVVAGFAGVAFVPVASAHVLPAATTSPSSCPSGNAGSSNYCEPHCVVPRLVGYSVFRAVVRLKEANCKLGTLILTFKTKDEPPLIPKFFTLFAVTRQFPAPGTILRDNSKVTLWVKFP